MEALHRFSKANLAVLPQTDTNKHASSLRLLAFDT